MQKPIDLSLYYLLNIPSERDPIQLAQAALAGGVTAIQLRAKQSEARELFELATALKPITQQAGALLFINDRVDVALAANADGVHIGKDDLPLDVTRKMFPGLIGVSCYGSIELAQKAVAGSADYVAFGSFYASPTKPHAPRLSFSILEEAKSLQVPTVAIGGITEKHVAPLFQAGVDGIAVISAIQNQPDPQQAAQNLRDLIQENTPKSNP